MARYIRDLTGNARVIAESLRDQLREEGVFVDSDDDFRAEDSDEESQWVQIAKLAEYVYEDLHADDDDGVNFRMTQEEAQLVAGILRSSEAAHVARRLDLVRLGV